MTGVGRKRVERVLMTVDAVGGVWRFAMDLAKNLKQAGLTIVFAGFGPPPGDGQKQEAKDVGKLIWLDAPLDWTSDDRDGLRNVPALLKEIIALERIDVAHLNLPSQMADLDTYVPVIVMSHSCVTTWFATMRDGDIPSDFAWHRDVNREGLRKADIVVAPSQSHAALLKKTYGDIGPVAVVHNATDLRRSAIEKENFILAAGRWWDEGKNGKVLEYAAANLRWPFLFAGSDQSPRSDHILLTQGVRLGQIEHDEVTALMQRAAVFVSPSRYEPFGLAALEAARCGCALVLADIPTYRELWDGAAVFADPVDEKDFFTKLEDLLASPEARTDLGERAYRQSCRFNEGHQAREMIALYRQAIARAQAAVEE